jgi:hypothetical protein
MARNRFTDPATADYYDWQVNHSEEDEFGKRRNIEHGATTSNLGFVKQQSDDSPLILRLRGTIFHKAQLEEMIAWWKLSEDQTIYFLDFAGDEYEVVVTSFLPTRQRTTKNPRDYANAPYWYWKYEMEMEVIAIRDGSWEGVTP